MSITVISVFMQYVYAIRLCNTCVYAILPIGPWPGGGAYIFPQVDWFLQVHGPLREFRRVAFFMLLVLFMC